MEQKIKADKEDERNSWNEYISKSIDPFLIIRYIPGFMDKKIFAFLIQEIMQKNGRLLS